MVWRITSCSSRRRETPQASGKVPGQRNSTTPWASETGGGMKQISGLMFGLLALLIVESPAAQSNYPEKPIRLVAGFPAGSSPDIVARLLGQKLAESLGKPVVVENVAGAASNIAAERVAKAAPDGYTLGLLTDAIVVNPSLYKLTYDPVRD